MSRVRLMTPLRLSVRPVRLPPMLAAAPAGATCGSLPPRRRRRQHQMPSANFRRHEARVWCLPQRGPRLGSVSDLSLRLSASLTFQLCWLRLCHPRRQSTLHRQAATTLSRPTVGSNSNAPPPPRSRSAASAPFSNKAVIALSFLKLEGCRERLCARLLHPT